MCRGKADTKQPTGVRGQDVFQAGPVERLHCIGGPHGHKRAVRYQSWGKNYAAGSWLVDGSRSHPPPPAEEGSGFCPPPPPKSLPHRIVCWWSSCPFFLCNQKSQNGGRASAPLALAQGPDTHKYAGEPLFVESYPPPPEGSAVQCGEQAAGGSYPPPLRNPHRGDKKMWWGCGRGNRRTPVPATQKKTPRV